MDYQKSILDFYRKALTVNTETTPQEVLTPLLAEDFVSYGSVDSKGKAQLIGQLGFFWTLIPDLNWDPKEVLISGNKIVVRSEATGTPNGDFMGLPTDGSKSFRIMTIDIHTLENGKIKTVHHLEDWGTAMKQLRG